MRDYTELKPLKVPLCEYKILFGEIKQVFIAFVIPTYHRFDLLQRCVGSILNQVGIESVDYQIIISDNEPNNVHEYEIDPNRFCCFNSSPNIVYCVNLKNFGGAVNCNQCVAIAESQYICMVHDDDVLHPLHLKMMMEKLKETSAKYLCSSLTVLNTLKANGDLKEYLKLPIVNTDVRVHTVLDMFKNYSCNMLGSFIDRQAYMEIGGLNGESAMEDYIFSLKFLVNYGIIMYPIKTYGYVIQDNDSLNVSVCEKNVCEKYNLRKFLMQKILNRNKCILRIKNRIYLARDIAYFESNRSFKKMKLSRKYIKSQLKICMFDIRPMAVMIKLAYNIMSSKKTV